MKAFVTGATGVLGANLVRALLASNYDVRVLVRPSSDTAAIRRLGIEFWPGNVLDANSLVGAADDCTVVFHAAAVFAYWGYTLRELEDVAVLGTRNVFAAAHQSGVKRVVATSSSVVLGSSRTPEVRNEISEFEEPHAPIYTISKVRQERAAFDIAGELDLDLVVVCPTLTVGAHDYRLSPSNASIVNYLNDPFRSTFVGGCNVVSARDVATGHIVAAERGEPGTRYVLGADNLYWREVHALVSELGGTFGPSLTLNHTMSYVAAAAAETTARLTGTKPVVTRDEATMAGRFYWYSSESIARLGYRPSSSADALAEALAWVIHRGYISESVLDSLSPDTRVNAHNDWRVGTAA